MNKPVNVYGSTSYYENGLLECIYDGFGYEPRNDEFHLTTIARYGNGCDLSEL